MAVYAIVAATHVYYICFLQAVFEPGWKMMRESLVKEWPDRCMGLKSSSTHQTPRESIEPGMLYVGSVSIQNVPKNPLFDHLLPKHVCSWNLFSTPEVYFLPTSHEPCEVTRRSVHLFDCAPMQPSPVVSFLRTMLPASSTKNVIDQPPEKHFVGGRFAIATRNVGHQT